MTSDIQTKLALEKDAFNLIKDTLSKSKQKKIELDKILKLMSKIMRIPTQKNKIIVIISFTQIRNAMIDILKMFNQDIPKCKIKQEKKLLRINMQNFFMATHSLLKRNYDIDLYLLLKISLIKTIDTTREDFKNDESEKKLIKALIEENPIFNYHEQNQIIDLSTGTLYTIVDKNINEHGKAIGYYLKNVEEEETKYILKSNSDFLKLGRVFHGDNTTEDIQVLPKKDILGQGNFKIIRKLRNHELCIAKLQFQTLANFENFMSIIKEAQYESFLGNSVDLVSYHSSKNNIGMIKQKHKPLPPHIYLQLTEITEDPKKTKEATTIEKIGNILNFHLAMIQSVKDCHDKRVIHNDLKPDQFLLSAPNEETQYKQRFLINGLPTQLTLTDFGLSFEDSSNELFSHFLTPNQLGGTFPPPYLTTAEQKSVFLQEASAELKRHIDVWGLTMSILNLIGSRVYIPELNQYLSPEQIISNLKETKYLINTKESINQLGFSTLTDQLPLSEEFKQKIGIAIDRLCEALTFEYDKTNPSLIIFDRNEDGKLIFQKHLAHSKTLDYLKSIITFLKE